MLSSLRSEEGGMIRFHTAGSNNQLKGGSHGTCADGDPATDGFGLVAESLDVFGSTARYDLGRAGVGPVGDQYHWLEARSAGGWLDQWTTHVFGDCPVAACD